VNGLVSGFTGEGAKTVLPSVARAKFSMRLVPNQDPEKISALVRDYLLEIAPDTVTVEIVDHHGAKPVLLKREGKAVRAAAKAYERGFGKAPSSSARGGSVASTRSGGARRGSILLGLWALDDAHAPNAKLDPDYYAAWSRWRVSEEMAAA
jgi:acetylornithine deacetylase/succinyl-diaminopimelate desuccinylase-like protein